MNIDFPDMGGGIIHDLPANQLPRNVWSDGNNVRFIRTHVRRISGDVEIFGTSSASGTIGSLALGLARWLLQCESSAGVIHWVYCDLDRIYQTDGTTHLEITHSATSSTSQTALPSPANEDYGWNGGTLNRTALINSHAAAPRYWTPNTGNVTHELSAWPAATTCRVLRPYKNYMIALGLDEGAGFNDQILRWSHPVTVGENPTNASWDYADTTLDSGRIEIDDGFGRLVDCMPMRNDNIIYTQHAIYRQMPVSTGSIFNFRRIFSEVGLLTRHCIATVRARQVFIGDGDIYVHDGHTIKSIITKRWKSWFFSQLGTNWSRSYVCPVYSKNEIWFCFPTGAAAYPNRAMIWSFDDNTLSSRDLDMSAFIGYGVVPELGDDTFDTGPILTFNEETEKIFNQVGAETTEQDVVMAKFFNGADIVAGSSTASSSISSFFEVDSGLKFDTTDFTAYVEKDALILEPDGKFTQRNEYQIHAIRPRVISTVGGNLGVKIGMRNTLTDPIDWVDSATFVMGTDEKVDIRATGGIVTIRFENSAAVDWELDGFSVDFDKVGSRR